MKSIKIFALIATALMFSTIFTYITSGSPTDEEVLLNRFTFTKKELESESDLYYFNARHYNSFNGRFTSPDPAGGFNRYVYCKNNPLNLIDPTGMMEQTTTVEQMLTPEQLEIANQIIAELIRPDPGKAKWLPVFGKVAIYVGIAVGVTAAEYEIARRHYGTDNVWELMELYSNDVEGVLNGYMNAVESYVGIYEKPIEAIKPIIKTSVSDSAAAEIKNYLGFRWNLNPKNHVYFIAIHPLDAGKPGDEYLPPDMNDHTMTWRRWGFAKQEWAWLDAARKNNACPSETPFGSKYELSAWCVPYAIDPVIFESMGGHVEIAGSNEVVQLIGVMPVECIYNRAYLEKVRLRTHSPLRLH